MDVRSHLESSRVPKPEATDPTLIDRIELAFDRGETTRTLERKGVPAGRIQQRLQQAWDGIENDPSSRAIPEDEADLWASAKQRFHWLRHDAAVDALIELASEVEG